VSEPIVSGGLSWFRVVFTHPLGSDMAQTDAGIPANMLAVDPNRLTRLTRFWSQPPDPIHGLVNVPMTSRGRAYPQILRAVHARSHCSKLPMSCISGVSSFKR
jgi:hypothetical protein